MSRTPTRYREVVLTHVTAMSAIVGERNPTVKRRNRERTGVQAGFPLGVVDATGTGLDWEMGYQGPGTTIYFVTGWTSHFVARQTQGLGSLPSS